MNTEQIKSAIEDIRQAESILPYLADSDADKRAELAAVLESVRITLILVLGDEAARADGLRWPSA